MASTAANKSPEPDPFALFSSVTLHYDDAQEAPDPIVYDQNDSFNVAYTITNTSPARSKGFLKR